MSDEAWVPTYEKVAPHSLCCAECKKAREEAARLRDGLRLWLNVFPLHRDTCGFRTAEGCTCGLDEARATTRALLVEDGAAHEAPLGSDDMYPESAA